ncbi:hypothetical protein BaRGS_00000713 [Batillaria attramentaria]|uniref:Uncharacterized protein n=1 Tax=Batillaria attramentaria TaxID=370345 RepID=A0ABD0M8C3_9CAEN
MADAGGNGEPSSSNAPKSDEKGLENFITNQLSEQRACQNTADNIDEEKMNRFLARALSESRRMNQEVEKSKAKISRLHGELGVDRMTEWQREHAAEVLTPQQAALVNLAEEKN